MENNDEIKRMQELAGIKTNTNLSTIFKQIHENSFKISANIDTLINSIKEHKDVNNRKH
jgi:hypothetical protein